MRIKTLASKPFKDGDTLDWENKFNSILDNDSKDNKTSGNSDKDSKDNSNNVDKNKDAEFENLVKKLKNKPLEFFQTESAAVKLSQKELIKKVDEAFSNLYNSKLNNTDSFENFLLDLPWSHENCLSAINYILENRLKDISNIKALKKINLIRLLKPHQKELTNIVNRGLKND